MLSFLLLSVVTIAGASLVIGDFGEDDEESEGTESPEGLPETDAVSLLDFVSLNDSVPDETSIPIEKDTGIATSDPDSTLTTTDGDDAITIDTGGDHQPGHAEYLSGDVQYYPEDDDDPITQLDAGAGNDSIIVESGTANIVTGEGADTVDASGMDGGRIEAGSGDVIHGSDVAADPDAFYTEHALGVSLQDDAEFIGGDANEYVVAFGDGATVDGGAGDDVLLNFDGAATLSGGTGNDVIDADASESDYEQDTRNTRSSGDSNADVVDGGDGDDRIFVGAGDTVTGGDGDDFIQADFPMGIGAEPVTFTDFEPTEDTAKLVLHDFPSATDASGNVSFDPTGRVEVMESDGDSHVFVDDELVAVLEDTQGLVADAQFVPEDPDGGWSGLEIRFR